MDGLTPVQLQLDFRTGRPTTITGPAVSADERAACSAINAKRVRGILQVSQLSPSRESLPPDVWAAAFIRKTREWDVPLISLSKLGLSSDEDGFLESRTPESFQPLKSGAEACPYADIPAGVVYKLFFLLKNGGLGKKLSYELNEHGRFDCLIEDATLLDTLSKLSVLHDAGAHPTEIVGLSDDGKYLIAKQPLASPYQDFDADQRTAIDAIKGVTLSSQGFRSGAVLIWIHGQAWAVSDLHKGNIMRDADDQPTIIDALTGAIPPLAYDQLRQVREAVQDAKDLREGRPKQTRMKFEDVDVRVAANEAEHLPELVRALPCRREGADEPTTYRMNSTSALGRTEEHNDAAPFFYSVSSSSPKKESTRKILQDRRRGDIHHLP